MARTPPAKKNSLQGQRAVGAGGGPALAAGAGPGLAGGSRLAVQGMRHCCRHHISPYPTHLFLRASTSSTLIVAVVEMSEVTSGGRSYGTAATSRTGLKQPYSVGGGGEGSRWVGLDGRMQAAVRQC